MPLADWQIRELALRDGMITPFVEDSPPGAISSGLSAYGFDLRLGNKFKVFTNAYGNTVIDPKKFDPRAFVDIEGDVCVMPPHSFILAETVETVKVPRGFICILIGKSTYCRCGLILNTSPIEPEWRGKITLEISNTTPLPAYVYANEGIGQLMFFRGDAVCEKSYSDKKGIYQDQIGVTAPRVR